MVIIKLWERRIIVKNMEEIRHCYKRTKHYGTQLTIPGVSALTPVLKCRTAPFNPVSTKKKKMTFMIRMDHINIHYNSQQHHGRHCSLIQEAV
jgi:hypothetical protein